MLLPPCEGETIQKSADRTKAIIAIILKIIRIENFRQKTFCIQFFSFPELVYASGQHADQKNVVAEFYMAISNEISTKGVIFRTGIIHAYPLSSTGNYYHLGGHENVHICIFLDLRRYTFEISSWLECLGNLKF